MMVVTHREVRVVHKMQVAYNLLKSVARYSVSDWGVEHLRITIPVAPNFRFLFDAHQDHEFQNRHTIPPQMSPNA